MTELTFAQKRAWVRRRVAAFGWRHVVRRENKELAAAGYRKHETDWEVHRGARMGDVIVDARISACGRYVWTKLGKPEGAR